MSSEFSKMIHKIACKNYDAKCIELGLCDKDGNEIEGVREKLLEDMRVKVRPVTVLSDCWIYCRRYNTGRDDNG